MLPTLKPSVGQYSGRALRFVPTKTPEQRSCLVLHRTVRHQHMRVSFSKLRNGEF